MQLVARPCPVCGASDESGVLCEAKLDPGALDGFAFASRKLPEYMHHRLLTCPTCDLVYASPIPPPDYLFRAYADAAFDSSQEAGLAAATYAQLLPRIACRLPNLGGALDIGTGEGAFLARLLQAGFSGVVGVEPSKAPIAAASESIRHLIREGIFEPTQFTPESFALVTCFQTIEHLWNPMEAVTGMVSLLKPGGALYLVCHNRRAFSARILGDKSPIFDLEHLQLFSPKSAGELMRRAGLVDVEVRAIWNRYPLHYWLKLVPLARRRKERLLSLLKSSALGNLPLPLPAGNLAVIGYKC